MNLFVKSDSRMMRLLHQDILFFEGYSDYVKIFTKAGKPLLSLLNLKMLEKRLPAGMYCRVHRSYIVAIDKIDFVERKRIGIGSHLIPISESYAGAFFGLIREMELSG
jgi:DNA-binding LytR/AlgR family response regulator